MSKINNEPIINFSIVNAVRGQLEQRAIWLYLLNDENTKNGIHDISYAKRAVTRCGLYQGNQLVKKGHTDSLIGLKKTLFDLGAQIIFEMQIVKSTPDLLFIDFHYCPLVKGWQKMGCSDEEIANLCDVAMCGDHAIASCFNAVLQTPKRISRGDDHCALRYYKWII